MTLLTKSKRAAQAESQRDFERLYRGRFQAVYAYVAYRVGQRDLAEDLTSQIFERAWRGFAGFDPGRGTAATWLFGIARNCVADHFRQSGRQPQPSLTGWPQAADAAAAMPDTQEEALSPELRAGLAAAWQKLPERQREILSLKFGGGLSNRAIAALLELSESNVGTILYRSLTKLHQQLKTAAIEDPTGESTPESSHE